VGIKQEHEKAIECELLTGRKIWEVRRENRAGMPTGGYKTMWSVNIKRTGKKREKGSGERGN